MSSPNLTRNCGVASKGNVMVGSDGHGGVGVGDHDNLSWSPGDASLWARKHENTNANPPPRPGRGDGLLGDMPHPSLPPRPPTSASNHHRPSASSGGRRGGNGGHFTVAPQRCDQAASLLQVPSVGNASSGKREWRAWVDYRSKIVSNEELELESAHRTDLGGIQDFQR